MPDAVDVDLLWRSLGTWGLFQKKQLIVILISIWSCGFHVLSIVFIGYRPEYKCKEMQTSNVSLSDASVMIEYDKCSIRTTTNTSNGIDVTETACTNGMQYSIPKDRSFLTEWDLVCDRASLAEVSQTLVMIGQAIGAGIFTSLSDRFGRKTVHVLSHIALFAITIVTAFVPNYTGFAVLRLLTGAVQQGVGLCAAILSLEFFPKEARGYSEVLGLVFWSTGIVLITPFGYFLRNVSWRYFQIAVSLCSAWALIEWWLIHESPRWLIANGKVKEAKKIIKRACVVNKKDYDEIATKCGFKRFEEEFYLHKERKKKAIEENAVTKMQNNVEENGTLLKQEHEDHDDTGLCHFERRPSSKQMGVKKYTVIDLLKSKRLLVVSLMLWFAWITNSLTYYGIMLISSNLAGDRFLNFFLSAVIEYPAAFLEYAMINRLGRKKTSIFFHGLCGIALFIATALTTNANGNGVMETASTVFTLLGKMCITGSFSTIFLYTPELYPTNMRNVGIGMSSAAARLGAAVAPYSRNLAELVLWGPGAIFGSFCIIVTVLMFFIPETNQFELPQTMEELKEWYKLNQFGFAPKTPEKKLPPTKETTKKDEERNNDLEKIMETPTVNGADRKH